MAFMGMRGTGDWAPNQRPENWRQTTLFLYPNGSAPLTALMSMHDSEPTDDPVFHWWTKRLPDQGGDITGLFEDANLSNAVAGGKTGDNVVYAQVAESVAKEFRRGHTAMLSKEGELGTEVVGEVVSVGINSDDSYIAFRLLEDASTTSLVSADGIDIIGNANAEGAEMPDSVAYDPVEYFNYTQIWRTPLSITRTARKTRLRTDDAYREAKRECLELHAIEMEMSSLWSVRTSKIGANGKPKRTTMGLIPFLQENAPEENVDSFVTNSDFSGKGWLDIDGGELWLNERLEVIFRFGRPEKLGLIGNRALLGLNRLAQNTADINIQPTTVAYGIKVLEWITPFGTIYLKTHPLFNRRPHMRNDLLIFEPENLKFRHIDDTFFIDDPQDQRNRNNSRDATEEEFLTEGGFEHHHAETAGLLSGLGQDASG